MNNKSPSLPMSTIIASDAPLLSPLAEAAPWDSVYDVAPFPNFYLPPSTSNSASPIAASKMLKMRTSPDSSSDSEQQLCLPTHQVFDFPEQQSPVPSALKQQELFSASINPSDISSSVSTASKRSASPTPAPPKKRATGERVNSKDFVPPDVSGLSKREARLVKNRAAAFLSRQRKREEFECMEIRVAELEQENARLLALTQNGNAAPPAEPKENELVSEVEELKAQLEAAKERERQLAAELMSKTSTTSTPAPPAVKIEEATDLHLPFNTNVRSPAPAPYKSGASLGLMVLLCALPTLLSMPMNSAVPKSFALPDAPLPVAPSAFDFNSFIPNDYDWSRNSANTLMDLDDVESSSTSAPTTRRLEFSTSGASFDAESGLDGLDISFDTIPTDNGKIRVRIHPSSSASSRAASPGFSDSKSDVSSSWNTESEPSVEVSFSPQSFSSPSSLSPSSSFSSLSSSSSSYLSPPSPAGDPFLGVGAPNGYSLSYPNQVSDLFGNMDDSLSGTGDFGQDVGYGSEYSIGDNGSKRRVRIALKSLPTAGGEGGEWEVQIR